MPGCIHPFPHSPSCTGCDLGKSAVTQPGITAPFYSTDTPPPKPLQEQAFFHVKNGKLYCILFLYFWKALKNTNKKIKIKSSFPWSQIFPFCFLFLSFILFSPFSLHFYPFTLCWGPTHSYTPSPCLGELGRTEDPTKYSLEPDGTSVTTPPVSSYPSRTSTPLPHSSCSVGC